MSDNTVEVIENITTLEITSSTESETSVVEIVQSGVVNLELSTVLPLLPSNFTNNTKTIISETLVGGSGIVIGPLTSGSIVVSTSGLQPSGNYSLVGHSHNSSDITNFNSSVSGLLPVKNISAGSGIGISNSSGDFTVSVTGTFGLTGEQVDDRVDNLLKAGSYVNLNYNDSLDSLTISVSGLQPSGNYSLVGHSHEISDINNLQNALDNKQPSGIYASGIHYHVASDITDFNSSVSGLLPASFDAAVPWTANHTLVDGTRYLVNDLVYENGRLYRANYENESIPTSSDLYWTDVGPGYRLNIDGRDIPNVPYPVKNIISGSGISVSSSNGDFTVAVSGQFGLTGEEVDDRINDLLIAGSNIILNYDDLANQLTISTSGLQPSGNYSLVGHSHTTSDITDFNSGVSGLLPVKNVLGSGYVNVSSSSGNYTISVSGLQPSGNYANSIHTHTTSDITDFNSSVSGLIPVKNILAGSGIVVSSTSGIYTIDANISGVILETIQDNLGSGFLVAGTGVKLTYNDVANTLRLDNLHTEINELSLEPQGFVNRLDSIISFNDSTRTFTIAPTGASYDVYIEGVKVTKTTSESIVIGSGTALNYIHFNTDTGLLDTKTTFFNFDTDVPIAFIHWNGDINQSTFFGEERHGIRMDSMTHKWIHNTFGMQYINGLSIGGYTLLGNGSSNSHAQIDISDGTLYQEDIIINIVDGNNGVEFTQQLSPIAYIPVYYHSGSTGQWVRDVSTPYPLKYNATRALYNLYSGGTWTTPNVPNNRYFAMWIVATNDMNDPILAIMGQREDSSLGAAENNNIWSDINLTNIPTNELRPLYRLIFLTNATFTNTPKSSLQSILDIRKSVITSTYGVSQNDHGSLFGLGDDDHAQYVHINEARSISANHTFTNGLTISSGLLSANSGNFTSLSVNNVQVSVSGHTHTASNITNFNSSVSGLFPANLTTGVGTSGYVSRWNGTNSLTSGIIYDNGTNVGLGTSTPSETLHVIGSGRFSGDVTALGSLIAGSGTASLPSIEFISDADTGAFSPAANTFAVSTSGTERLRITGTGAVGINTTAPSGRLHVFGDSYSQGSLYISRSGTTVPITYNRLFNDTSDSLVIRGGDNEIALGGQGGTISIKAFSQWTEIGNNYNAGTTAQHIKFTPAATERMRLTNTGNLGIGTTAPSGRLHVAGGSGLFSSVTTGIAPNALLHAYSATSGDTVLNVEGTNGSLFSVIDSLSGSLMSVNNNAGLPVFEVFSNDSIVAGRYNLNDFVINSSGNIGIGQNNPSEKLEVAGNIKANNIIHPFLFMGG